MLEVQTVIHILLEFQLDRFQKTNDHNRPFTGVNCVCKGRIWGKMLTVVHIHSRLSVGSTQLAEANLRFKISFFLFCNNLVLLEYSINYLPTIGPVKQN